MKTLESYSEEYAVAIIEKNKKEILRKINCSTAASMSMSDGNGGVTPNWPQCDQDPIAYPGPCYNCACCV